MTAAAAQAGCLAAADAPAIRVAGLGKVIDDYTVLDGVSFEVAPGCCAALLGANGAGKTTLLRILGTLLGPTRGTLALFGRPATRTSVELRRRIGLIGHGTMLYRDLTARENLVFYGRLYDLSRPSHRAAELLDYVGLADRGDDPLRTFSRGMAQRVAIARALMHDPDLLLADEPFAGLDAPSGRRLEVLVERLHGDGRTIVLATHDVARSLSLAQRALVLRRGRLVIDAPTARLDPGGVLAEMTGP